MGWPTTARQPPEFEWYRANFPRSKTRLETLYLGLYSMNQNDYRKLKAEMSKIATTRKLESTNLRYTSHIRADIIRDIKASPHLSIFQDFPYQEWLDEALWVLFQIEKNTTKKRKALPNRGRLLLDNAKTKVKDCAPQNDRQSILYELNSSPVLADNIHGLEDIIMNTACLDDWDDTSSISTLWKSTCFVGLESLLALIQLIFVLGSIFITFRKNLGNSPPDFQRDMGCGIYRD
jgi:phage-related protein